MSIILETDIIPFGEHEEPKELTPVEEVEIGDSSGEDVTIGYIKIPVKLHRAFGASMHNIARFKFADTTLEIFTKEDKPEDEVKMASIGGTIGSEIEVSLWKPDLVFKDTGTENGNFEFKGLEQYNINLPNMFYAVSKLITQPKTREYIKSLAVKRNNAIDKKRKIEKRKRLIEKIKKAKMENKRIVRKLDDGS